MFGINGGEFVVLIVLAILIVGPERMPQYASQLREWVVMMRDLVSRNKDQLKSELGDDIDWKQYDPRQYDPRRIVRDALNEPAPKPTAVPPVAGAATAAAPAPFDADAT
jgi:sec-independent protein translocase protein TatB